MQLIFTIFHLIQHKKQEIWEKRNTDISLAAFRKGESAMSARNARDLAYHTVRSRIITMELKPGDPLNDRELAEELGEDVSDERTPLQKLRDAFN